MVPKILRLLVVANSARRCGELTDWEEHRTARQSEVVEGRGKRLHINRTQQEMKFCKNLQRVIDISDPEWAPYWINYKGLKRVIKELSSSESQKSIPRSRSDSTSSIESTVDAQGSSKTMEQHRGDITTESTTRLLQRGPRQNPTVARVPDNEPNQEQTRSISNSPGEVAFFKILHGDLRKAEHFFERTTAEYEIREDRVRTGMDIVRSQKTLMVNDKWRSMSQAIYRLYKDLLLLETFAIMTYVGFSKILKKHDKMTGYTTCKAFMESIVHKANFTHYPDLMSLISRVETLYNEMTQLLEQAGKKALSEDELLFLGMIHRLNAEVLESDDTIPRRRASIPGPGSEKQSAAKTEQEGGTKQQQCGRGATRTNRPNENPVLPPMKRTRIS